MCIRDRDDSVTTTAAGATVTAVANAGSVTTPPSTAPTLVPAPNALRSYASYNPVLSLLVTTPAKYGKLNDTPFLGFNTTDWQVTVSYTHLDVYKRQFKTLLLIFSTFICLYYTIRFAEYKEVF